MERKLKENVTVEDIENLVLSFLSAKDLGILKDDDNITKELHQKLWRNFYNNMTDCYLNGHKF